MALKSLIAASALLVAGAAQASLVTNGSFESGMTGWTCVTSGAAIGDCFAGTQFPIAPVDGLSYFVGYQNTGPAGTLSQLLATEAGASYSISFSFNTDGPVPPNALSLSVGDLDIGLPLQEHDWINYSGSFTAAAAFTSLDFFFSTNFDTGTVLVDHVIVERIGTVPVPTSLALVALGLAGLAASRRQRRR